MISTFASNPDTRGINASRASGGGVGVTGGDRGVARAYNGVWGRSPQRGPEAEPLFRGSGHEAPPPEAESFLTFGRPREAVTFESFTISEKLSIPEFLHPSLYVLRDRVSTQLSL